MEKVDNNSKVVDDITFYDFAPIVLDLFGMKKLKPEFPFGRQIYNKNYLTKDKFVKHNKPDNNDLSIIYKFLHFERGKNIIPRYNLSRSFKCYRDNSKSFLDLNSLRCGIFVG